MRLRRSPERSATQAAASTSLDRLRCTGSVAEATQRAQRPRRDGRARRYAEHGEQLGGRRRRRPTSPADGAGMQVCLTTTTELYDVRTGERVAAPPSPDQSRRRTRPQRRRGLDRSSAERAAVERATDASSHASSSEGARTAWQRLAASAVPTLAWSRSLQRTIRLPSATQHTSTDVDRSTSRAIGMRPRVLNASASAAPLVRRRHSHDDAEAASAHATTGARHLAPTS